MALDTHSHNILPNAQAQDSVDKILCKDGVYRSSMEIETIQQQIIKFQDRSLILNKKLKKIQFQN